MTDWDQYARTHPHRLRQYEAEPVQLQRAHGIVSRCVGDSVLDVGSSDGFIAWMCAEQGYQVTVCDISPIRVERAKEMYGIDGQVADAIDLPYEDGSFDTVVLGEILEHMDNPGLAFAEACRVARERVIVTVPLNGWADPTHQWRISLDRHVDFEQRAREPTKGEQIVLTWQRGRCWPPGYERTDPSWADQFFWRDE